VLTFLVSTEVIRTGAYDATLAAPYNPPNAAAGMTPLDVAVQTSGTGKCAPALTAFGDCWTVNVPLVASQAAYSCVSLLAQVAREIGVMGIIVDVQVTFERSNVPAHKFQITSRACTGVISTTVIVHNDQWSCRCRRYCCLPSISGPLTDGDNNIGVQAGQWWQRCRRY
jgi:hypothetical protein